MLLPTTVQTICQTVTLLCQPSAKFQNRRSVLPQKGRVCVCVCEGQVAFSFGAHFNYHQKIQFLCSLDIYICLSLSLKCLSFSEVLHLIKRQTFTSCTHIHFPPAIELGLLKPLLPAANK